MQRQKDGQIKRFRCVLEARGDEPNHHRSKGDAKQTCEKNGAPQKRKHIADESLLLIFGLLLLYLREHRYKRLTESSFCEQAAQHVRDPESDVKSVGCSRNAEITRDQHIADQTGDARQQREDGNRGRRLE